MSSWCCFLFFLLPLFQTCSLSSPYSSSSSSQLCHSDERYALLELKQKHHYVHPHSGFFSFNPYSKYRSLKSWKPNTDCCYWEGITCDGTTGHVVGLDLTYSSLNGSIHSNSTLFHLPHLQMLNLSWNKFNYYAPSGFDRLSKLMHLNLSGNFFSGRISSQISQLTGLVSLDLSLNNFGGKIPCEISQLTKLVFLDLSGRKFFFNGDGQSMYLLSLSQLEIPNLSAILQNLSSLRELHLDGVNLSSQKNRDWFHHFSATLPNLHVLSMRDCSLIGPLNTLISSLHTLSELYLDLNENLSSTVPNSLMNLTSLTVLSLRHCGFYGDFPTDVFLQPNLKYIDISENPLLSVHLPEFSQNNSALQYLATANTKFQGKLPSSVGNLKFLKVLYLWNCNFSGPIPLSLANLTHLTELDLSENSFSGQIPSFFRGNFPNLEVLQLGYNLLQGPIHSYLFFLPSLSVLALLDNQFSGVIDEHIHNISSFSSLKGLDLSGNYLKGQDLVRSLSKIKGTFGFLDLSSNDFGYIGEDTNLSYNSLSINGSGDNFVDAQIQDLQMNSCNLSKFPDFLKNQKELFRLDLSSNRIGGAIPKWIWQKDLSLLDLSNNSLTGLELPLPNHSFKIESLDLHSNMIQDCFSTAPCFPQTPNQSRSDFASPILGNLTSLLSKANFFSISENNLTGKIPFSICNASNLEILDLSSNQLSGPIPTCLGNSNLGVLNLENNKLHGPIPLTFKNGCSLHTLKLNKNMLQGEVPRSLSNCKELKVLDIGDNQLNDTFPYWLENLSKLEVLVMRSNKFGGPIAQLLQVGSPFPSLHVVDISFNAFTGSLPLQYILQWRAMMNVENNSDLNYISYSNFSSYYQDKLVVADKGLYLKMPILTTFTTIDLSNNSFKGEIPDALGNLKALIVLNLSGNSLTGQIPFSLGNLSELESLDLSRNQLSGEIPRQLTSLTFLSDLNVSYNNLKGSIPQGNQFNTFSNDSYMGNAELCGLPLSRKCGITDKALHPASTSQQNDDSTNLLDWKFVIAGSCAGLIIGLVAGQQLFWRNNQYFECILRISRSKQRKALKKKHHNKGK